MKTLEEKFKIIEVMEEVLKILLEVDDVQIIMDIDLDGEDNESLPKAAEA
jgi:hypothetical protein